MACQVDDSLTARADGPAYALWHVERVARVEWLGAIIQFDKTRAADAHQQHINLGIDVRRQDLIGFQPHQIHVEVGADQRADDARPLLFRRVGLPCGQIEAFDARLRLLGLLGLLGLLSGCMVVFSCSIFRRYPKVPDLSVTNQGVRWC